MNTEHRNIHYEVLPDGTSLSSCVDSKEELLRRVQRLAAAFAHMIASGMNRARIIGLHDDGGWLTVTLATDPFLKEMQIAGLAWEFVGEDRGSVTWDVAVPLTDGGQP